ncbi:MAG: hypothetical protein JOS17DRAFT_753404 [Linnemannia elongata]|nr:MAG: hypothetical protein JOS17DRAFT_753404 [Linnemannia elongata]
MKLSTQLCSLVFCSLLWSISTEASPNSAVFASYATVEESTLYIQGGVNTISGDNMYQFYSLDLTKNWDISNQPWSEVITADPIPAKLETWGHSISLSRNQKTLTFWNINGSVSYAASFHLDTNTWEALPPLNLLTKKHFSVEIIKAATDPRTDQVYIPGGSDKGMLVYSPDSKSSTALELGPSGKNGTYWSAYSFVWSDVRKSFLYFGGYDFPGAGSLYFYEYSPGRLSPWSPLSTSGSAPPALVGSCMVPAYSGTKMLVYGGSSNDEAGFDTLYILDVPTMTWSQGAKYQPRFGMVCSVSGDYLIVWGGFGISQSRDDPGKTIPIDETLIIYNIKTAQWTTQFIANDNALHCQFDRHALCSKKENDGGLIWISTTRDKNIN